MKEKIRLRRTSALILGFIGTIIVMRPDVSIELGAVLNNFFFFPLVNMPYFYKETYQN